MRKVIASEVYQETRNQTNAEDLFHHNKDALKGFPPNHRVNSSHHRRSRRQVITQRAIPQLKRHQGHVITPRKDQVYQVIASAPLQERDHHTEGNERRLITPWRRVITSATPREAGHHTTLPGRGNLKTSARRAPFHDPSPGNGVVTQRERRDSRPYGLRREGLLSPPRPSFFFSPFFPCIISFFLTLSFIYSCVVSLFRVSSFRSPFVQLRAR